MPCAITLFPNGAYLTREALQIARRLDDPQTLAYALDGTYSAFSLPRDTDAWLAMARELMQLADEIGDKEQAFSGHFHALASWSAVTCRRPMRSST